MTTTTPRKDFVASFVALLPDPTGVSGQPPEFWSAVRVPADRVLREAADPGRVASQFAYPFGNKMLQALCLWLGLPDPGSRDERVEALVDHLAANRAAPCCQDLLCLLRFLHRRRREPIQVIARSLLPEQVMGVIGAGDLGDHAEALAYAMQVYYAQPSHLRLVMAFEEGEPLGYDRHSLVPKRLEGKRALPQNAVREAEGRIERGAELNRIDADTVNTVLKDFEAQRGNRNRSACLGIHVDHDPEAVSVFILRELREALIPEVERTLFGDEAGLVVLRFRDGMRVLEEHSEKDVGPRLGQALAGRLLGTTHAEYVSDVAQTGLTELAQLLHALRGNRDRVLRLREIDVKYAPIDGSPRLRLECDKADNLSAPLDFLDATGIRLTAELDDVSALGIVVEKPVTDGKVKLYIMRVTLDRVIGETDRYVVRYFHRGVPAAYRGYFEQYLRDEYNVIAIPATRP